MERSVTGVEGVEGAAEVKPLAGVGDGGDRAGDAQAALERARAALLSMQHPDGHWCAELEGDSILQSEFILMKFILGQEDDPEIERIAAYLRSQQAPNGGWVMFPGGEPEISGTVKAYFCLKLLGDDPEAEHMRRAREVVHRLGGAERCNTFTKFFFACLGQVSFDACPSIPPEVVWLPRWSYFNLYNVSAWTRTMILPLGIVTSQRYVREIPADRRIDELYLDKAAANRLGDPPPLVPRTWEQAFLRLDRILKWYDRHSIGWIRRRAIRRAERWILDRLEGSEGLGAIFPPMVYMLIVYRVLGYSDDDPRVVKAHAELRDFYIREGETTRIQPCLSPVWDTGLAMHALGESGLDPESREASRGVEWLLAKECREPADWAVKVRGVEPSGWYFEYANPHYPDTDDTAMATAVLHRLGGDRARDAVSRGHAWLMAMQNDDGGWAAFDKTKDRPILEKIPFADHNAMQDPSCPDITGRVLESLGCAGRRVGEREIDAAVEYLKREQDPSGAWWGRWGVNYVYGTWQVLTGLWSVGQDMEAEWIRRGGEWLRSVQREDGSFGETPDTYRDPALKGTGEPTASQTAWGAMGMMVVFGPGDPAVERAIGWLARQQNAQGTWDERWFTGTGFPDVFYLRYHLYPLYFPLTAIARYSRLLAERPGAGAATTVTGA